MFTQKINKKSVFYSAGLGAIKMQSEAGNAFDLQRIALSDIKTDEKNFQNRADKYSEKSVNAIIKAVKNGSFNWFAFDPVLLWQAPNGDLFILSGHSRTEAFRRLEKEGVKIDNLDFSKIPAKIFKGSFEDAQRLALNSNALSTPESLLERAEFYAKERQHTEKKKIKELKEKALRENQGAIIWDLSYLLNDGLTKDFLKRFKMQEDSEEAFENYLRAVNIASWIGRAFAKYAKLSTVHDRELFNFLYKNYGNKTGQYNSFAKLDERLKTLYNRNVANADKVDKNGNYTTPFGLRTFEKTDDEILAISDAEIKAKNAKKELTRKIKSLRGQNADKKQLFDIITPYFNEYINSLADFWLILDAEQKKNTDKNQTSLFGVDSENLLILIYYLKSRFEKLRSINQNNEFIFNQIEKILGDFDTVSNSGLSNEISTNLGKPTIKFEFESNDDLKNFLKENKDSLIDSFVDVDGEIINNSPSRRTPANRRKVLNGLYMSEQNNLAIFNCPESLLICKGFTPTYKRLTETEYNNMIAPPNGQTKFCGYGFDKTTLQTLVDCCRYYPQVAKLAAHLKDKDYLQSAFNVWHWLHTNIYYNYDAPGKEEIRTPARVWADRKNGVDCDCLAVFAACLFICMGYKPKFEIVGFGNSDKYSHIFVNLNGAAVDRVLPVFMQRPALITKTFIMDIPVFQLSGLNGTEYGIDITLNGVYDSTLKKIANNSASENDILNKRKLQVLLSLQGCNKYAYQLAGLIMPHVAAIDEKGYYYFRNPEVAKEALKADYELNQLLNSNASESRLNGWFGKLFKKIASGVNKVTGATMKAADKVVSTTANATKNAGKATINLFKGDIKEAGKNLALTITEPTKAAYDITVDLTKNTVIDPVVDSIKIGGELFKVIFITLNPVTILIRNSLRLLVAINFLGMASRLNVGAMTKAEAASLGYSEKAWDEAKTARNRVIRLFKKMGGEEKNIVKAIQNGSKKKALFRKDYKDNSKIVEIGEDSAELSGVAPILTGLNGLGEAVTIASAIIACAGIVATIWKWIANVIAEKRNAEAAKNYDEQMKLNAELYEVDENGFVIYDEHGNPIPKGTFAAEKAKKEKEKKQKIIKYSALAAGVTLAYFFAKNNNPKKKRRA